MTINLHDTTDAAVWAAEFCKIFSSAPCRVPGGEAVIAGDDFEEIMHGWFASAIMAGVDSEARKAVDTAAIKVKPLVWELWWAQDEDRREYAKTPLGPNYHVSDAGWWFALCPVVECNGREAAKAAAQADYEARILSAIEAVDPAAIRAEALREAGKAALEAYDKENPFRTADYHGDGCDCLRCRMDVLRALIDKEQDHG